MVCPQLIAAGDVENGLYTLLGLLVLDKMPRGTDGSVPNPITTGHLIEKRFVSPGGHRVIIAKRAHEGLIKPFEHFSRSPVLVHFGVVGEQRYQ